MTVQPGTPTTNKKWRIDLDLDLTGFTGNWAQVKGLNNITPAVNNTVQDATDYDDDIWGSDAITGRKWQLQGQALRKEYAGSYDEAQEAMRSAADNLSLVHVRWYERGNAGGEAYEGFALVQWEPQGGDPTGLSSASFTLLGQGARTPIANPSAAAAVPVINSLSPAQGAAAGGDMVVLSGSGLSGTTAVTVDGAAAEDFIVVSDAKLVFITPAGVAGPADVVATNGVGPSTTGTGDFEYV